MLHGMADHFVHPRLHVSKLLEWELLPTIVAFVILDNEYTYENIKNVSWNAYICETIVCLLVDSPLLRQARPPQYKPVSKVYGRTLLLLKSALITVVCKFVRVTLRRIAYG